MPAHQAIVPPRRAYNTQGFDNALGALGMPILRAHGTRHVYKTQAGDGVLCACELQFVRGVCT